MARPDLAVGDALFAAGAITAEQLAAAKEQAAGPPPVHIAKVLLDLGHAEADAILGALDRAWEDDPAGDAALARALVSEGLCEQAAVDAARTDAGERAEAGSAGRMASLLVLRGDASSEAIEQARTAAAAKAEAHRDVPIDDVDLDMDLATAGLADIDLEDDADLPDLDEAETVMETSKPPGTVMETGAGGDADLPDLGEKLAEKDGGFERFEPAPAAPTPHPAPPPTHAGSEAPTIAGAPPTLQSGPPPTLFGATPTPDPDPDIDQAVAGYVLLRKASQGACGITYEASRESDGMRVALKLLDAEFAADAGFVAQCRTAADSARELLHDNIARVVEVHLPDSAGADEPLWVAAEWTEGETIADLLRRARMPVDRVARIGILAGRALHPAHERALVHGRVRPECVVLDMGDRAVVTGIGMPSLAGAGRTPMAPAGGGAAFTSYAAPESAAGAGALDRRSDVYSLGATLYEMMTGQPPFPPGNAKDLQRRGKGDGPQSPRKLNPRVPPQAEAILLQAISHEPNRRYSTAQALAEDLERFRRGERVRARGASWFGQHRALTAGLALAGAALIGVPAYLFGTGVLGGGSTPGVVDPDLMTPSPSNPTAGVVIPPQQVAQELGEVGRDLSEGRPEDAARKIRGLLTRLGPAATRTARLLAARAYRLTGDLKGAERQLTAVLTHDGDSAGADAVAEQGLLALSEGRAEDALTQLEAALKASTDSAVTDRARRGKGQALLMLGRADEARAVLEEAGDSAATLALLAEAQLAAGALDAAAETGRRAATKPLAPAYAHYAHGLALEAQLKPEQARQAYRQAASPVTGRDRRGQIALNRLRDELERINGLAPKVLNSIEQEVRAANNRVTPEAAERMWVKCGTMLDRTYSDAMALRLRRWRMQLGSFLGKVDETIADASALLTPGAVVDPGTQLPAYEVRAQMRYMKGDIGGAIADASEVLSKLAQPGAAASRRNQAMVLRMLILRARAWVLFGDFQAAAADADTALKMMGDGGRASDRSLSLVASAVANGFLGQAQAVKTTYQKLLEVKKHDENAVGIAIAKGAVAVAERRWAEAVPHFEKEAANTRSAYAPAAKRCLEVLASLAQKR